MDGGTVTLVSPYMVSHDLAVLVGWNKRSGSTKNEKTKQTAI
jgi:hypothetical protein